MSYFSALKVRYPDNKFIFYPVFIVLLAGILIWIFVGLSNAIFITVVLSLLIILVTIFHTYREIIQEIRFQDQRTQAMFNIYELVKPRLPLPYLSGWAAFPELINAIIEEVKNSKPNHIVEIGSGSSTIITSYILEELGKGKITSYDHDQMYGEITKNKLRDHGLENFAEVVSAPLTTIIVDDSNFNWYDVDVSKLKDSIDLIVVDGPPEKTQKHARYPALPIFYEHLSKKAVVILDDAGRQEEQEIIQMWMKKYPEFRHEFIHTEKGISILRRD